jgi:hypothetical protein
VRVGSRPFFESPSALLLWDSFFLVLFGNARCWKSW